MPTCQERWPCCFSMVFSIHLGWSGSVTGTGVGDRALKVHRIAGGRGLHSNVYFQFRVLCANYEECVVFFFLEILFVICNIAA
jgi:hypothetical protein